MRIFLRSVRVFEFWNISLIVQQESTSILEVNVHGVSWWKHCVLVADGKKIVREENQDEVHKMHFEEHITIHICE